MHTSVNDGGVGFEVIIATKSTACTIEIHSMIPHGASTTNTLSEAAVKI